MAERTITVRGIAVAVLERLRARVTANRRSLNGELLAPLVPRSRASVAACLTVFVLTAQPAASQGVDVIERPERLAVFSTAASATRRSSGRR